MSTQEQRHGCDERLLRDFLEQRLSAEEEAQLERHLDGCADCRRQIADSTADEQWWTKAGRYLKPDCWDEQNPDDGAASGPDRQSVSDAIARAKFSSGSIRRMIRSTSAGLAATRLSA